MDGWLRLLCGFVKFKCRCIKGKENRKFLLATGSKRVKTILSIFEIIRAYIENEYLWQLTSTYDSPYSQFFLNSFLFLFSNFYGIYGRQWLPRALWIFMANKNIIIIIAACRGNRCQSISCDNSVVKAIRSKLFQLRILNT